MRVFVFPIDMDEYLVAPSGSPAFSIHDILDKCNPSRSSDLVFARDNIRCLTCPDIQLEAWDKLDEGTHPMTLFDGKAGPIDPWANRTNEARVKSMVNANCARTFYVHGATLHKHLKGCSTHKVHRSCAYVAHMRSLFANRGKNRRYGQTDEWKGYIERVQAVWTERMLNNTYSVSQLPT